MQFLFQNPVHLIKEIFNKVIQSGDCPNQAQVQVVHSDTAIESSASAMATPASANENSAGATGNSASTTAISSKATETQVATGAAASAETLACASRSASEHLNENSTEAALETRIGDEEFVLRDQTSKLDRPSYLRPWMPPIQEKIAELSLRPILDFSPENNGSITCDTTKTRDFEKFICDLSVDETGLAHAQGDLHAQLESNSIRLCESGVSDEDFIHAMDQNPDERIAIWQNLLLWQNN